MAMLLDAFTSYVQNMLTELTADEVPMLLGVAGEIDQMGFKLWDLKNFLADAERRFITDKSVQEWVTQLKHAMYEATVILDICRLKAMEQGPSTEGMGCFNPLLFCLRNPLHAHNIGSRIKALNQRLETIKERSAAFNFINLGSYEDRNSKVRGANTSRETSDEFDRSGVVGDNIEEDTKVLVEIMLTEREGSSNIMVVAIVGVAGIGKTTLAQKVFNDEAIKAEFHKMIWLSVNQDFSEAELLRAAIKHVGGDHRTAGNEKAALQRTLVDALNRHKILLVMDDVWNHRAWTDVLRTPFVDAAARGSRVLVTTRHDTVAIQMKAVHCHHVDKLGPDDAWLLLKKQVIPSEINEPEVNMLKDIGLRIIQKCDGLPLAIKVMGGLLRQKELHHRDWEMVLHDSIWSVSEMPEELSYAVYLSYEDLPPGLRQCFLHYSILPNNTEFSEHDIIGMWISEGFLHGNADELEELGSNYYKELILRNLIEHDTRYVGQSVCKMQNIVRSFAQYVARDEALVGHNGKTGITSKLNLREFIRLSIETKELESDEFEWSFIQSQTSLRTLILVGHFVIQSGDSLAIFPSLRTLHIECANFAALVKYLYELKHLRYLSIAHTDVSILPENISQLKFLQHISLVGCEGLVKLPDSIVKLGQLRYLGLNGTNINGIPRSFGALMNLRRLYGFPAHMDGDWCSLEELGPLSQLRALGLKGLENVSSTSSASKARLGEKVHLTELLLHCSSRVGDDGLVKEEEGISEEEQCRIEELFDELCPPPSIETVGITKYFCRHLPRWMMSTCLVALNNLRTLTMNDLACCTQLPDGLSMLPSLEFVQIEDAPAIKRVGHEFLRSPAAAFPRLRKMNLSGMVEWEEWEWEEQVQAMRRLEVLVLKLCKLTRLPPGLASNATTLKELHVENVQYLNLLENFPSLVELKVVDNPDLQMIINLPNLQKLTIVNCPKMKVLECLAALWRLMLGDYGMETLPEYMRHVKPMHLQLDCSLALLTSIAAGQSSPEWDKLSHIEHVKAYAYDGDIPKKWYVMYTRDPYNLETNISVSSMLADSTIPVVKDEDELIVKDGDELIGKDEDELVGTEFSIALCKDDSELVGIDGPCEDLIKLLVHGEDTCEKQLKLVSICGIGGLGKTTIAAAVYRKIANKFDYRAFVSVSHKPDETKITQSISDQVGCPCHDLEECDIQQLIDGLRIFLQDKREVPGRPPAPPLLRYLIVVDDIWDVSVWNLLKPALINNINGSSIITTTRFVDVAKSAGGVYELPLLSYNESKMLFYRRTSFHSEDGCPSQYKEICESILSKCGRLPLAIIAITSSLPDNLEDLEEWKKVCSSIGSGLELGKSVEDMRMILSRSYEDLPLYLKNCLLYLSIFPEDYEITRDNLVQRWIAEDLIHGEHGQNLQKLGESYFNELVKTGMIREGFGKDVSCCLPVLMLDLIVYLSSKENFVTILSGQRQTDLAHKVQRLSLQVGNKQYALPKETKTFGQMSTLSIFCGADFMLPLSNFRGLHVLDLEKCDSLNDQHLKDLVNLVELRYLVLGSSDITKIPRKFKKLRHLQTLDLTATGVEVLPSSIVMLTQLRRLFINRYTKVPAGIIGNLQYLEELADIGISKSPNILEDISTMRELRVLSIALWSWDERQSRLLPETLCKLSTQKLKHLSICTSCLIEFQPNLQPVLKELEKLDIQGSTFDKLPNWIGQLAKLRSLSIEVYSLEKGTFEILGGLFHLRFLSLTAKRIPGEKEKLVVGSDGFRSLRTFHLSNRAMAITFEKEAMQGLQRLELILQASLTKEFFFGLENLSSLKHVQVEIICFSATDGAVEAAEAAIESMIGNNPNKPTLGIERTMEDYKISDTMREAGREAKAQEESVSARKKSRKARKKNKRKH